MNAPERMACKRKNIFPWATADFKKRKTKEENSSSAECRSIIKEELMISDMSDYSDEETTKEIVREKCVDRADIEIKPVTNEQQSFIKEEVMIPDLSDASGDEDVEKIDNFLTVTNRILSEKMQKNNKDKELISVTGLKSENDLEKTKHLHEVKVKMNNSIEEKSVLSNITNKTENKENDCIKRIDDKTKFTNGIITKELKVILKRLTSYDNPTTNDNRPNSDVKSVNIQSNKNEIINKRKVFENTSNRVKKYESRVKLIKRRKKAKKKEKTASHSEKQPTNSAKKSTDNTEVKKYQCDYCSYRGTRKMYVCRHIRNIHLHSELDSNGMAKCDRCGRLYKGMASLRNHKSSCGKSVNDTGTTYRCDYCSYQTMQKTSITIHIVNNHSHRLLNEKGIVECEKCGLKYNGMRSYRNHRQVCGKPAHLPCSHCYYRSKYRAQLRQHLRKIHKIVDENEARRLVDESVMKGKELLKNDTCKYMDIDVCTGLQSALKLHCTNCKTSSERSRLRSTPVCDTCGGTLLNECRVCGERFQTYILGRAHLRQSQKCAPPGERCWCDHCGRSYKSKSSVRAHILQVHMPDPHERYKCRRCDKIYKCASTLLVHLQSCGKPSVLKCEFCKTYRTANRYWLMNHVRGMHCLLNRAPDDDILKPAVQRRGKRSKTITGTSKAPDLLMSSMTEEEKLKTQHLVTIYCPKCGMKYKGNRQKSRCDVCGALNKYRCIESSCGRVYSTLHRLRRHIKRQHLLAGQSELYKCSLCERKFLFYDRFRRHILRCKKDLVLSCGNCDFTIRYVEWKSQNLSQNPPVLVGHSCPGATKQQKKTEVSRRRKSRARKSRTNVSVDT